MGGGEGKWNGQMEEVEGKRDKDRRKVGWFKGERGRRKNGVMEEGREGKGDGKEGKREKQVSDELTEGGMKGEKKRLASLKNGGREDCMNNPGGV